MTMDDVVFLTLTCAVALALTASVIRWGSVLAAPVRRR
jgi:hypothetical protein